VISPYILEFIIKINSVIVCSKERETSHGVSVMSVSILNFRVSQPHSLTGKNKKKVCPVSESTGGIFRLAGI